MNQKGSTLSQRKKQLYKISQRTGLISMCSFTFLVPAHPGIPRKRVARLACLLGRRRARVQIAAATLSGNSLRQTVHTHRASVHRAAKLVAALSRVARVTAGLAESNGRFCDSRHLQADCQEPGSAREPYTPSSRVRATFTFF